MAAPTANRSCVPGRPQRERAAERLRLRSGNLADPRDGRPQQLEQAGERYVSLRLHAARPQHFHAGALVRGVGEQRGLADARLPDHGQDPALTGAGIPQQPDERLLLPISAEQHAWKCTSP